MEPVPQRVGFDVFEAEQVTEGTYADRLKVGGHELDGSAVGQLGQVTPGDRPNQVFDVGADRPRPQLRVDHRAQAGVHVAVHAEDVRLAEDVLVGGVGGATEVVVVAGDLPAFLPGAADV